MADTPLRTPTLLSVGAPVYDEEELVEEFVARACAAVADYEFELVIVNDGSSDSTPELLDRIAAADPRVRGIHLSRHLRHHARPPARAPRPHRRRRPARARDPPVAQLRPPGRAHRRAGARAWRRGGDAGRR